MLSQFAIIKSYLDERSRRRSSRRFCVATCVTSSRSKKAKQSHEKTKNEPRLPIFDITCHSPRFGSFFCAYGSSHYYLRRFPLAPSFVSSLPAPRALMRLLTIKNQQFVLFFPLSATRWLFICDMPVPKKIHNSDDDDTKRRSTVLKKAKEIRSRRSEEEMQNIRRRDNCWRTTSSDNWQFRISFFIDGLAVNPARLTPTLRLFP